jgi:hypothetical protein
MAVVEEVVVDDLGSTAAASLATDEGFDENQRAEEEVGADRSPQMTTSTG